MQGDLCRIVRIIPISELHRAICSSSLSKTSQVENLVPVASALFFFWSELDFRLLMLSARSLPCLVLAQCQTDAS